MSTKNLIRYVVAWLALACVVSAMQGPMALSAQEAVGPPLWKDTRRNGLCIFVREGMEWKRYYLISGVFPLLGGEQPSAYPVVQLPDLLLEKSSAAIVKAVLSHVGAEVHECQKRKEEWILNAERQVKQWIDNARPNAGELSNTDIHNRVQYELRGGAELWEIDKSVTDLIETAAKRYHSGQKSLFSALPEAADASIVGDLQQLRELREKTNDAPIMKALNSYIGALKRDVPTQFKWCDERPALDQTVTTCKGFPAVVAILRKAGELHKMVHSEDLFLYMKTLPETHEYSLKGESVLPVFLSRRDICDLCERKFERAFATDPQAPWHLVGPIIYLSQIAAQGGGYDVADNVRPFHFYCQTDKLVRVRISDTLEPWSLVQPQPDNCVVVGTGDVRCGALKICWRGCEVEVSRSLMQIPGSAGCPLLGYVEEETARVIPISFLTATRLSPEPSFYPAS